MTTPVDPTRASDQPDSTTDAEVGGVTESETPVEALVEGGVSEEEAPEKGSARAGARARVRIARLVELHPRLRGVWELATGDRPSLWSARPASLAEVFRYACTAEWCSPDSVYLRRAGQAYCLLAIFLSALAYGATWVLQRPGRGVAVLVLIVILRLFT